jgi:hypothetical protein
MENFDDDYDEESLFIDDPPLPQVSGLSPDIGRKLYLLLMKDLPTKDNLILLFYTLKLILHSPNGPVFAWQYLTEDHVRHLAKHLATLLRNKVELKTLMVRECYEIIIRISRHFRVKDHTKGVYTQWILAASSGELTDLHVIYKYLSEHDNKYGLNGACKYAGTGCLRE